MNIAIIVAGGSGSRLKTDLPKQYARLASGEFVIAKSIKTLASHPLIDKVLVVINSQHIEFYLEMLSELGKKIDPIYFAKILPPVYGGLRRQDSVLSGLMALQTLSPANVLIHDAARPFLTAKLTTELVNLLASNQAVIPVHGATDTLRMRQEDKVIKLNRTNIYAMQTPQSFHYPKILELSQKFNHIDVTDDAEFFELGGLPIYFLETDNSNFKITHPLDLKLADLIDS